MDLGPVHGLDHDWLVGHPCPNWLVCETDNIQTRPHMLIFLKMRVTGFWSDALKRVKLNYSGNLVNQFRCIVFYMMWSHLSLYCCSLFAVSLHCTFWNCTHLISYCMCNAGFWGDHFSTQTDVTPVLHCNKREPDERICKFGTLSHLKKNVYTASAELADTTARFQEILLIYQRYLWPSPRGSQ